jgi:hypothetical protein
MSEVLYYKVGPLLPDITTGQIEMIIIQQDYRRQAVIAR